MADHNPQSVLALQLCKITADARTEHSEQYANLYKHHHIRNITPHCYMTLGGFDAISFYKLCETSSGNWLEKVLDDRRRIIKALSGTMTYHPVHLLGEDHTPEANKILFLTFVYGVETDATFEDDVKERLEKNGVGRDATHIYQCINLSERVIFTYSNNIAGTLQGISSIVNDGLARKVYTTASFPLEQECASNISSSFIEYLTEQPFYDLDNFFVCIKGSAKKHELWEIVVGKLLNELGENSQQAIYYNYGEDDFVIELQMNPPLLLKMLNFFMREAKAISASCWDIHTELQIESNADVLKVKGNNTIHDLGNNSFSILDGEYKKLKESVKSLCEREDTELESYSWYYSLLELFPTLRNMDHHPLLKGPAYVMYDSLRILNFYLDSYLKGKTAPDSDSGTPDLHLRRMDKIFRRSEERSISLFIRCLSRLADQLVQNDDVVFHGLGQEPAIATTQPESLLEFYHGFLRELADYLTKIDQAWAYIIKDEDINDENRSRKYEYGFLLSPELNQRACLSELFWLKMKDRKPLDGKKAWPVKQAYIIQLPAEDVFRPMYCFFPLAHECFHIFGDKLRFRNNRFYYMTMFVSATLLAEWGKDDKGHIDMFWEVCKQLSKGAESFWNKEIYMRDARSILEQNLHRLLSDCGMEDLYYELGKKNDNYLYTVVAKRKTKRTRLCYLTPDELKASDNKGSSHIDDCAYYFTESYADVMACTTFDVKPCDYLKMFVHELRYFEKKNEEFSPESIAQVVGICQRIAIVLAALSKEGEDILSEVKIEKISPRFDICLYNNSPNRQAYTIKNLIKKCYISLIRGDAEPLQPNKNGCKLYAVVPVSALAYVVNYLREVVKFYQNSEKIKNIMNPYEEVDGTANTMGTHLREVFDKVIRKENFFGLEFKKVVSENRHRIDDLVKKDLGQEGEGSKASF